MRRGPTILRSGRREAASSTRDLIRVQLQESLAPGGNAKAFRSEWDGSDWVSSARYMSALMVNSTDPLYVANLRLTADSTNEMFAAVDVGGTLTIQGGERSGYTLGNYTVSEVRSPVYTDLVVNAANAKVVSSAASPFTDLDMGLELLITSEDGFIPGLYTIVKIYVASHTALLDRAVGTVGATGGRATGTPIAKLRTAPAEAGSTSGSGVMGASDVYDVQGAFRALGTDDLGDPVRDLVVDGSDDTVVSNAGTAFSSSDVGKTLVIEGGSGFRSGIYKVLSYDDGSLTLDRTCGYCDATGGYGVVLRTDGAVGLAESNVSSGRMELVAMHQIAKIAKGVVAGAVSPDSESVYMIDVESMDGGQSPLSDAVIATYSDLCSVAGNAAAFSSATRPFSDDDVGLILTIDEHAGLIPGNYVIASVDDDGIATLDRSAAYVAGDLEIPAGETTIVESASITFATGLNLTIMPNTVDDGFNAGIYGITTGSGGTGTLDGTVGDAESVGGIGYLSGEFNASGRLKLPLVIANDGYSIPDGAEADLLWDEATTSYRCRPLRSHCYDRCECVLMYDLGVDAAFAYVKGVQAIQGASPLVDSTSETETLRVVNRGWDSTEGYRGDIRWNNGRDYWEFDYLPCKAT